MGKRDFTAVDSIRKTLLNYELMITAVHTELTSVQATISRYKGYKTKSKKRLYEVYYWEEKRLLRYLDALREGQLNCKNRIKEFLQIFYPIETHQQVRYMHFIENKSIKEIAEATTLEGSYIRRLINKFRKDLIEIGCETYENAF